MAKGRLQMPFDHAVVGLISSEALIRGLDGGFQPLAQPLAYGHLGGLDILAAVEVVEQFGKLPLGIALSPFHREPLLYTLLLPCVGYNLIADIENDVPTVFIAFTDAASHVILLLSFCEQASPPSVCHTRDGEFCIIRLREHP
jgi:hypothetical protein